MTHHLYRGPRLVMTIDDPALADRLAEAAHLEMRATKVSTDEHLRAVAHLGQNVQAAHLTAHGLPAEQIDGGTPLPDLHAAQHRGRS